MTVNSSPRRGHRLLAGLGAAALLGLAGALGAPAAVAAQDPVTGAPAPAAAGWLARQMVDGERFETEFDGEVFPDQGLTLDAALAFAAAGVAADHADAAFGWLATPDILDRYLGTSDDSRFAGSYAKLAYAAQVYGRDPAAFGGVDLLAGLGELRDGDGRYRDDSPFGDFSNAFTQSFAVLAVARAGGDAAAGAGFLAGEQCDDGGFPEQFAQPTCESDVDATAVTVQALLAAGGHDGPVVGGSDWLAGEQGPDGAFGGAGFASNANSTGLAAQALRAGGRDATADDAVEFLRTLQVGCDGPEDDHGMVVFSADDPGDAPRATAQAVLGLAGTGLADLDGTTADTEAPVLDCESGPGGPGEATPTPTPTGAVPAPGQGGEKLPVTGAPLVVLAAAGSLLLAAGGTAMAAARRRRS